MRSLLAAALAMLPCAAAQEPAETVLIGTVLDAGGAPAAEARVTVDMSDMSDMSDSTDASGYWSEDFTTATGPEGHFELHLPRRKVTFAPLRVSGRGDQQVTTWNLEDRLGPLFPKGDVELGILRLEPAVPVRGRIEGLPPGDWILRAELSGPDASWQIDDLEGSLPSQDGAFEIWHLPPGRYSITFLATDEAAEHAPMRGVLDDLELSFDHKSEGLVATMRASGEVSGRVIDTAGGPIEGARIYLEVIRGRPSTGSESVFTDAEGHFRVTCPPGDGFQLAVSHDQFADLDSSSWRWFGLDVLSGPPVAVHAGDSGLELVLERVAVRKLFVVDAETGEPIESLRLWLRDGREPVHFPGKFDIHFRRLDATTYPGGWLELPLVDYPLDFAIVAKGFAPIEGALGERGVVVLEPGGTLRGQLAVEAGAAPADLAVTLRPGPIATPDERPREVPTSRRQLHTPFANSSDLDSIASGERTTTTTAEGHFEFTDLATGSYELLAHDQSGSETLFQGIYVRAGDTRDLGRLAIHSAGALEVRVAGLERFAPCTLQITDRSAAFDEPRTLAIDASGRVQVPALGMGEYVLSVISAALPGVPIATRPVELTDGTATRIEIALPNWSFTNLDLTFTSRGEPIPGAKLYQSGAGSAPILTLGETDATGRFVGTAAGAAGSRLWLSHPLTGKPLLQSSLGISRMTANVISEQALTEELLSSAGTFEVDLATLNVEILGADPDVLASGACLVALTTQSGLGTVLVQAPVDPRGKLTLRWLPPGPYKLLASPFGAPDGPDMKWRDLRIARGVQTELLDFRGAAPTRFELHVHVAGQPLEQGLVAARRTHQRLVDWAGDPLRDGEWHAELSPLDLVALDIYRTDKVFLGSLLDPSPASTELDLTASEVTLVLPEGLELPDEPRAALRLEALDPSNPMGRRTLPGVVRGAEPTATGVRWTGRSIELGRLPPGSYKLRVGIEAQVESRGRLRWKRQGKTLRLTGEVRGTEPATWTLEQR